MLKTTQKTAWAAPTLRQKQRRSNTCAIWAVPHNRVRMDRPRRIPMRALHLIPRTRQSSKPRDTFFLAAPFPGR